MFNLIGIFPPTKSPCPDSSSCEFSTKFVLISEISKGNRHDDDIDTEH